MKFKQLLQRQWSGYRETHCSRVNILIHALTAPVFLLGSVSTILGVATLSPWPAMAGVVAMASAMGLQALGHRLELDQPAPFAGVGDVIARIFAEQWVTFPRYLVSGRWRAAHTARDARK